MEFSRRAVRTCYSGRMASSSVAAPNLPNLSITSPLLHAKFFINEDAEWPSVVFETDARLEAGEELTWEWWLTWRHFAAQGVVQTKTGFWDAQSAITNLGGVLTVTARRGAIQEASLAVQIVGKQPDANRVIAFLAGEPCSAGFDKILNHEACMQHFDAAGDPLVSFDGGYGMAQLTNPAPEYDQVWNWKLNVAGGLSLFAQKRAEALAYLSRKGSFTENELVHETVSRWNGGSYHVWNPERGWIRKPTILCDSKTGNIGWDLTDSANEGKSEAVLHARDAGFYGQPRQGGEAWGYFGVCYADSVLGA